MTRLELPFLEAMQDAIEKNLFTITDDKAAAVVTVFLNWLTNEAQLKPLPNLSQKLIEMEPKLRRMAKNLKISFPDGRLVIKTDADSTTLLSLLQRGSDWFNPHPDVNAAILWGLTVGSQTK